MRSAFQCWWLLCCTRLFGWRWINDLGISALVACSEGCCPHPAAVALALLPAASRAGSLFIPREEIFIWVLIEQAGGQADCYLTASLYGSEGCQWNLFFHSLSPLPVHFKAKAELPQLHLTATCHNQNVWKTLRLNETTNKISSSLITKPTQYLLLKVYLHWKPISQRSRSSQTVGTWPKNEETSLWEMLSPLGGTQAWQTFFVFCGFFLRAEASFL